MDYDYDYQTVGPQPAELKQSAALYATRIPGRVPEVKFHDKGRAKSAVHYHFGSYKDPLTASYTNGPKTANITVYKLNIVDGEYIPIFDTQSELAYAVVDGEITLKEALEYLDWEVWDA